MNSQYGKRNRPMIWKTDVIIARYREDARLDNDPEEVAFAQALLAADDGVDGWDDGIHYPTWRSEVNERGENIRVFVGGKGYW